MKFPKKADLVIIGAGPAGLAAGIEARKKGVEDVLIVEREKYPGGILNQCIHDGFGVIKFGETLTGPEYAHRYICEAEQTGVRILSDTMVVNLSPERAVTLSSRIGYGEIKAGAVILATGCRERTRGALGIPGTRPAGVFTAGVVQHLVNLKNIKVGKRIVILGSGDIGLIMARRLTLEGAQVQAVVEKLPYPSGLSRNVTQCLEDYDIPLLLGHTVTKIHGKDRLQGVTISKLDYDGNLLKSTCRRIECDTLVLSVGLIPENEIALGASVTLDETTGGPRVDENLQTEIPGIFSCGNALQVHDLVDHVSNEGELAGASAASFITGKTFPAPKIEVHPGKGIRYVVPHTISGLQDTVFSMRVEKPFSDVTLVIRNRTREIFGKKFRRLNPAEMVRISLMAAQLKTSDRIEVEVVG